MEIEPHARDHYCVKSKFIWELEIDLMGCYRLL